MVCYPRPLYPPPRTGRALQHAITTRRRTRHGKFTQLMPVECCHRMEGRNAAWVLRRQVAVLESSCPRPEVVELRLKRVYSPRAESRKPGILQGYMAFKTHIKTKGTCDHKKWSFLSANQTDFSIFARCSPLGAHP